MKKKLGSLLAAVLALVLVALALPHQESQGRVNFYYERTHYQYGSPDGVFGTEVREVGQRSNDYLYLLALYLDGPLDPNLKLPFPGKKTDQVQTLTMEDGVVTIVLADQYGSMTDSEFNLSCACLAKTCLELTQAEKVKIISGDRTVNMTEKNLLLFDASTSVETENTEERK